MTTGGYVDDVRHMPRWQAHRRCLGCGCSATYASILPERGPRTTQC